MSIIQTFSMCVGLCMSLDGVHVAAQPVLPFQKALSERVAQAEVMLGILLMHGTLHLF